MTAESIRAKVEGAAFDFSPRFSAEAYGKSSPMTRLEIRWDDHRILGTAWHIDGSLLYLGVLPTNDVPPAGTEVIIQSALGGQELKLYGTVHQQTQIYGTLLLLACSLTLPLRSDPTRQRRANGRFRVGRLNPTFCFATNPITGRVVSFVVADVSSGGLGLRTSTPPWLLPGLRLRCRVDAATVGTFETRLLITATEKVGPHDYRVSAEFESLGRRERETLAARLVSASTGNSIGELIRERLLPTMWADLLRQDSRDLSNDGQVLRLQISGKLADTIVCSCVANIHQNGTYSTTDFYLSPLLGTHQLKEWLERRVLEYRDLVQPNRLRGARNLDALISRPSLIRNLNARRKRRAVGTSVVQWDEYAEAYDTMCSANPAYQENLSIFRNWISKLELPENARICDLGAGTGNYVVEAATAHPTAHVIHVDSDPVMNSMARRKYQAAGTSNISFLPTSVLNAEVVASTIDVVVCVNALYAFPNVRSVLARCRDWMKPGGYFFLIDLGRPMNVRDWSGYIISSNVRRHGITATVSAFIRGRKAIGQNRLIRKQQDSGVYWLHTPQQLLEELEAVGLSVQHAATCYRGACDLAICSKV